MTNKVVLGVDEHGAPVYANVSEAPLTGGKLGYLDRATGNIVIHSDQPEVGKHLILLHEMIHAAAENLKATGICKRQPSELFVGNLAGCLFGMLAASGLWNGVTPEDALAFMTSEH